MKTFFALLMIAGIFVFSFIQVYRHPERTEIFLMKEDKKFEPDSRWVCSTCYHGNPDSEKRCEYCGAKKGGPDYRNGNF